MISGDFLLDFYTKINAIILRLEKNRFLLTDFRYVLEIYISARSLLCMFHLLKFIVSLEI